MESVFPAVVLLGGFFLVIAMGIVVLFKRLVYGRAAVDNMPGWACWGTHLILGFAGLLLGAYLANQLVDWYGWEGRAAEAANLLVLPFMVGGYILATLFVGEGKSPDELRRLEFEKRKNNRPQT